MFFLPKLRRAKSDKPQCTRMRELEESLGAQAACPVRGRMSSSCHLCCKAVMMSSLL